MKKQNRDHLKQLWIPKTAHTRMDLRIGALRAAGIKTTYGRFAADAINEKIDREPAPMPLGEGL